MPEQVLDITAGARRRAREVALAPSEPMLRILACEIEALTRENPADWLWNYRRWKVQRDAEGNPHVVKSGEIKAPR